MNQVPLRKSRLSPEDRRAELEDAALACMARGGIREFTVDKIIAEAGVSRGLIAHHFGSIEGLLAAVYARMYREWLEAITASRPGLSPIEAIVEGIVSPEIFDRGLLNIWLALWGEIANNPILRDEHHRQYAAYRTSVTSALTEAAQRNGRTIEASTLASAFICLIDGLGVQFLVEPVLMTKADARAACWALLTPHIGPNRST